jgi:hypothetical protein
VGLSIKREEEAHLELLVYVIFYFGLLIENFKKNPQRKVLKGGSIYIPPCPGGRGYKLVDFFFIVTRCATTE